MTDEKVSQDAKSVQYARILCTLKTAYSKNQ